MSGSLLFRVWLSEQKKKNTNIQIQGSVETQGDWQSRFYHKIKTMCTGTSGVMDGLGRIWRAHTCTVRLGSNNHPNVSCEVAGAHFWPCWILKASKAAPAWLTSTEACQLPGCLAGSRPRGQGTDGWMGPVPGSLMSRWLSQQAVHQNGQHPDIRQRWMRKPPPVSPPTPTPVEHGGGGGWRKLGQGWGCLLDLECSVLDITCFRSYFWPLPFQLLQHTNYSFCMWSNNVKPRE